MNFTKYALYSYALIFAPAAPWIEIHFSGIFAKKMASFCAALKEFPKVARKPYLFDIILKIYYLSVVLLAPIDLPGYA